MASEEKNNSLNNLKAIHKLQMGGELQELLRDLRSSRSMIDEFMIDYFHVF